MYDIVFAQYAKHLFQEHKEILRFLLSTDLWL